MNTGRAFLRFVTGSVRVVARGSPLYYAWLAVLGILIAVGGAAYSR